MGITGDMIEVRSQLCARIDQISCEMAQLSTHQLASQVDDIRRTAHDFGLMPVEALARGLGNMLSKTSGSNSVRPFLESMRDAVGSERMDPATAQCYLASVNQRLYG